MACTFRGRRSASVQRYAAGLPCNISWKCTRNKKGLELEECRQFATLPSHVTHGQWRPESETACERKKEILHQRKQWSLSPAASVLLGTVPIGLLGLGAALPDSRIALHPRLATPTRGPEPPPGSTRWLSSRLFLDRERLCAATAPLPQVFSLPDNRAF